MKNCKTGLDTQLPKEYYVLLGNVFQMGFEIGISEKDVKCKDKIIYGGKDIDNGIIYHQLIKPIKLSEKYGRIINPIILYLERGETNGVDIDDLFKYLVDADKQCQAYEIKSNRYDYEKALEICKYKDKLNALNLLKSGYDFGVIFKKYIENSHKYQKAKIVVEPNIGIGGRKRPDAVVAIPKDLNDDASDYEIVMVVELKTQFYLSLTNNKIMLNDFVENIDIQSYTPEEFENAKNNKENVLYINNFKLLYNVLSKYGKGISYIEDIGKYPMECLVVFPSTASLFYFEDTTKLNSLKEKLEALLPSKVKVHGKGTYDISRILKTDLIGGLYNNGYIVKNGDNYLYKSKYCDEEDEGEDLLNNAKLCNNEECNQKNSNTINKNKNSKLNINKDYVNRIRYEHEEIFKPLLKSDKYDVIINASGQGIGKNTSLCKHILDNKLENENYITILFTPRKGIMEGMEKDFKEIIEDKENIYKSNGKYRCIDSELNWICKIHSEKDNIILRRSGKYHEEIVDYESSSEKLERIITNKKDKKYNLILCTSQTLSYYLVRNGSISVQLYNLLKYADLIVFDEPSNSDMTVKWAFLKILKYLNILKNNGDKHSKIVVLDASITSKKLYFNMLEKHLINGVIYTPLMLKLKKMRNVEGIK